MSAIFEAIPGIEVPVGSISTGLAKMWEYAASEGRSAPDGEHAKAIEVNLVLHLGFGTDAKDAASQFETTVKFSRRYPSRVVILCPLLDDTGAKEMRAKVYGECSIGKSPDDTRCCEFVVLSYPRLARPYLESQVSICLSTDLPIYYWVHRFVDAGNLAEYRYLLSTSRRVLFDSASAPSNWFGYPWPVPVMVRDLAGARLLPVRRSIGQFLGRYSVGALAKGLKSIRLGYGPDVSAEAQVMLAWLEDRIKSCGASDEGVELVQPPGIAPRAFEISFTYDDKRYFQWKADVDTGRAVFGADLGCGRSTLTSSASFLPPEEALAEAMFF